MEKWVNKDCVSIYWTWKGQMSLENLSEIPKKIKEKSHFGTDEVRRNRQEVQPSAIDS